MKGVEELRKPACRPIAFAVAGAGAGTLVERDPQIPSLLESLVDPLSRGDRIAIADGPARAPAPLADELTGRQTPVSHTKVAHLAAGQ